MDEKVLASGSSSWVDSAGMGASIACAIQCTVFPLLVNLLPLLGLGSLAGDGIERIFLVSSIVLAIGSFSFGFRHHRRFYIFLFLASGLSLIFAGRNWVSGGLEIPFVVSGTLIFAGGHLLNRRLCRLCVVCNQRREK